jgi:hypothetical protein
MIFGVWIAPKSYTDGNPNTQAKTPSKLKKCQDNIAKRRLPNHIITQSKTPRYGGVFIPLNGCGGRI